MFACMKPATESAASTESVWRERVSAWRASGESAPAYARGRGYAPSTLRYWASRFSREEATVAGFVRLVPMTASAPAAAPDLFVEVGGARVRVAPGFDAALLADLVRALGGAAR